MSPSDRRGEDVKMSNRLMEDRIIQQLVGWTEGQKAVRAMLLTSTRTKPDAQVDLFSDYDVILVVTDIHPFYEERAWLEDFGRVLVVYRDPIRLDHGAERFAYITQYEDGLKIDFTLWPVEMVSRIADESQLPDELDVGYAVLIDKEDLTAGLRPPTHRAYILSLPSREKYETRIEVFFHEATYTAKHLWRDDLMAAKYNLDYAMKANNLRQMLEWRIAIEHDWAFKPGAYGKGLKRHLDPETWQELESTYVGAGEVENWEALFGIIDLYRRIAIEVGEHLGYHYPHELDDRTMAYLQKVRDLDRGATSFP
jgi:aminoglycoside 6-adenylyltransferase